jgi:hypothetical protein
MRLMALHVDAEMRIVDPSGREMRISTQGGRGTVVVPRSAISLRSWRSLPPLAVRKRWAGDLQRAVAAASLQLDVISAGRTVARLMPDGRGNWLGRSVGLGPLEVRLLGVLGALLFPRSQ